MKPIWAGCCPKQLNNVMCSTYRGKKHAGHTTGLVAKAHVDFAKLYYFLFADPYYYFSNCFVTIKTYSYLNNKNVKLNVVTSNEWFVKNNFPI